MKLQKMKMVSSNKKRIWFLIHGAILFLLVVMFLAGRNFKINTNLFSILPDSSSLKAVGKAETKLSEKNGRMFFVLIGSESFEKAKEAALEFDEGLSEEPELFQALSLGEDENIEEIIDFFYKWRFNFCDSATTDELLSENWEDAAQEIAGSSLDEAYSGFSIMPLELMETDPFLLTSRNLNGFMKKISETGTSVHPKDGVLAVEFDGKNYVLLQGLLTEKGASISNKNSGVKKIYEKAEQVSKEFSSDEIQFIYSGIPFHSYESSSNAQNEIMVISIISMLLVILLFVITFRSFLPLICSVLAIGISALTAFVTTLIFFGEIHILTFVFGTTLIGTCLDYSLHFFVRWRTEDNKDEIRKKLFAGLTYSLISTVLCYLVLTFLPFGLLKQIAVFSLSGILSSYLTVIFLYPSLPENKGTKEIPFAEKIPSASNWKNGFKKAIAVLLVFGAFAGILLFRKNLRIENNLRSFYSMKGKLLEDEILAAKILNHGSSGWYFILKADSEDELLSLEENFTNALDEEIEKGFLDSYTALTKYLPSPENQKKSQKACGKFFDTDLVEAQLENLGYGKENLENYRESYDSAYGKILYPEGEIPGFLKNALSNLWIGEIDGKWYSAIMPFHPKDAERFQEISGQFEGVYFVNKMGDMEKELNHLTRLMLLMICVAWILMIPLIFWHYKTEKALRLILLPVLIVGLTVSVMAVLNVPLGFFSVTGIILIFGLGMDYMIYSAENSDKLNGFAIFFSFLTTAISFGALAFSSFMPVHMFGLTVFAGLLASYVSARIFFGLNRNN